MSLLKFFRNLNLGVKLNLVVTLTLAFLLGANVIITTRIIDQTTQTGQQRAEQETVIVQSRLAEAEQEVLTAAKLLVNAPGLVEAVANRDASATRTAALVAAAPLDLDDVIFVDAEGDSITSTRKGAVPLLSTEEEALFRFALLGIETTDVVREEEEAGLELHLAAAVPLRDASGAIVGGLVASRAVDDEFLGEINFSRRDTHLALVVDGEILAQDSPTPKRLAASSPLLLDERLIGLAFSEQTHVADDLLHGPEGVPYALAHVSLAARGEPQAVIGILTSMRERFTLQRQLTNYSVMLFALITLVAVVSMTLFVRRGITTPIGKLRAVAERMAGGDYQQRAEVTSADEIGRLADAFNILTAQLRETLEGLEQRTADLEATTADLVARRAELEAANRQQAEINRQLERAVSQSQRRATMLQASAEVSRAVTQIRDPDQLLPQITQLISRHFGFYHAGVFLIDEAGRYAVLRAANSEGGQRMLARRHKLGVGSESIVGRVTNTGQARIALDVGADAIYFDNPDMPDTRSEMALPLRIGDQVIGALDVQSIEEAAFDEEAVAALTTMAEQVAIAIQNARLFQQTQEALEEAQRAQRRYLRQEWSQFTQERPELAHEYTLSGISPAGDAPLPEAEEAWRKGELVIADSASIKSKSSQDETPTRAALALPIKIRDQVIGVLDLQEIGAERIWTEDEVTLIQAVADQLGQALEGARLFERTQASLAETQTLFQTSRSLAAAQEIHEVWQAVINAARRRRADACALLLFDTMERENARELVLAAGWDQQDPPRVATGTHMPLSIFDLSDKLRPGQPFPVNNVAQADDISEDTRRMMTDLGFEAFLHQPIAVRGRWFGLLLILYQSPHPFAKAETDFYRTLADQAALAIEGQRLLAETQRRAEREQLIRQVTDKVHATANLETILQTTVQELSKAMGLPRVFVRLGTEKDLVAVKSDTQGPASRDERQEQKTRNP
jgi:GAF domain-containing protein/HAMP domain-containing protein